MVRQARSMCLARLLGQLRLVEVEYLQDWLTERVEITGSRQAAWRTDPTRTGGAGAIGDIGVHAYDLLRYITGLQVTCVCADLTSFVQGRRVDDDARVLLRFEGGARGCFGQVKSRPATTTGCRFESTVTRADLNGTNVTPMSSGIHHWVNRRAKLVGLGPEPIRPLQS